MARKITKLLVANRGEIAVRIFRTCERLRIETVAVYSDADAKALHVRSAGEAVRLGPAPARESYLDMDAVLAAAKQTGADAIHPGYGFLSENAVFAERVMAAGLIWIGPPPAATRALGLKDEAKRIAEEAGVPVLPGYRGAKQDLKTLTEAAKTIGYPLLIKAVAGGGGRGIRLVENAEALKGELESAVREAESSFGDGRVMLEKLVQQPRHIEVQVFGDSHGGAVHLFERDCSFQRRRQKVIEEAPAPSMPEAVRAAMCGAAVKLAKAVGYEGAGTVEFIVDGSRALSVDSFWFLEMNTRLQVEHPVTEMITGHDLVEWQIRVAQGEALPVSQDALTINGHAIEARICAEDPAHGFRPGAGKLTALDLASVETMGGRADFGFEIGDVIPPDYDSMIGKVICHAQTRADAITQLTGMLNRFAVHGVPSNTGFIVRCLARPEFETGTHHVNLIAELGDGLAKPSTALRFAALQQAAHDLILTAPTATRPSPWATADGFRLNAPARFEVHLSDGETIDRIAHPLMPERALRFEPGASVGVTLSGESFAFRVPDYAADAEAALGGDHVKSPMPGKLIAIRVKPGDAVKRGDTLAVMEAMKMEHSLASPRDGIVDSINGTPGQQLSDGVVLVSLKPEA